MKRNTENHLAVQIERFASTFFMGTLCAALLWSSQSLLGQAETQEIRRARQALEAQEKKLGRQHPSVATHLKDLAALYVRTGEIAKAKPLYERALVINEKALGPKHPVTASSLNKLADVESDDAKAERFYKRALEIRERVLGPDHADVAETLNNLAELYLQRGERTKTALHFERAELLLQRALKIREKVFGPEHRDIMQSLSNLARVYESQGKKAKAEALSERAASMSEKLGLEPHSGPSRRDLPRGQKPGVRGTGKTPQSHKAKSL